MLFSSLVFINLFCIVNFILIYKLNFSRSKKDKTNDKRDASEDKKNNETDTTGVNSADSVGNFIVLIG